MTMITFGTRSPRSNRGVAARGQPSDQCTAYPAQLTSEEWSHPYTRRVAAFPAGLHTGPLYAQGFDKYWPPVGRIDGGYGDRNLVCICPPPEAFG
jgi:hypothetical protein